MALRDRVSREAGAARDERAEGGGVERRLVELFRRKLLEEVDLAELTRLDAAQRRVRLERVMGLLVSREGPVLSTRSRNDLIRQVVNEALGLGVLEPLLADPTVTEIMVNGPDTVYVERFGRIERVPVRFTSTEQLLQTIDRIVAGVNRRVDESTPMADARLATGERVNVVLPPLALDGPVLTIRRFPRAFTPEELVARGSLDEPTARLLGACVRARLNVVVSGGTGSGKTTVLNAMSSFIPASDRIVTIEDAAELQLQQDHVIRLETRPANVEGAGEVTARDLVRNALRMRPDRIIVGEVRGRETFDMLQAMNTGHEGSLVTLHANSAEEAVLRLETLASMSELGIPYDALRDQINSAVDLVVQLSRGADGGRRVVEVAAVASRRREPFRLIDVMRWEADRDSTDGTTSGRTLHFPLPERVVERFALRREPVPPEFATGGVSV